MRFVVSVYHVSISGHMNQEERVHSNIERNTIRVKCARRKRYEYMIKVEKCVKQSTGFIYIHLYKKGL